MPTTAAQPEVTPGELLAALAVVGTVAGVAVVVAVLTGLLRWRRVVGPMRLGGDGLSLVMQWAVAGGAVVLYLAVQIVVGVAYAILTRAGAGRAAEAVGSPAELAADADPPVALMLAATVASLGVVIPATLAAGRWLPRRPGAGWGVGLRKLPAGLGWGAAGLLLVLPVLYATLVATSLIILLAGGDPQQRHPFLDELPTTPAGVAVAYAIIAGLVPLGEELLFRGLLQTALVYTLLRATSDEARARWLAVVATSVLFMTLHPMFSWPAIFVFSLALGYAYERTGNLWVSTAMHAGFNAASLTAALLVGGA